MTSQVSFKFDSPSSKSYILEIINNNLLGARTRVEKKTDYVYEIFVSSKLPKEDTLQVCKGIQPNAIYDYSREL